MTKCPRCGCLILMPPRTTGRGSDNHALNGYAQQIADATGNEFFDVKFSAKRRAFRRGLPWKMAKNGGPLYSLVDGEPLPISETDMSHEQAGWVIEELIQIAAEHGVKLIMTKAAK